MGNLITEIPPAPEGGTFEKLGNYLNQVVALEPISEEVIATAKYGDSPAMKCVGWAWSDGKLVDLGTVLVFWGKVRAQLREILAQQGTVIAKLGKVGQAYVLEPAPADTAKKIKAALDF